MSRRGYLDWLRGVAVLIMIEAHTLDAWTRVADRSSSYRWAMVLAGYGAPFFLLLAGIALTLGAGSRQRRGVADGEAGRAALRRGAQVFGLAFLFRAQAWLMSGGPLYTVLKVDILNVMGLAMMVSALIWRRLKTRGGRAIGLALAAVFCTMVTPLVRAAGWLDWMPEPLSTYLRPIPGRSTFTMFPWAGFLFAGAGIGIWLDTFRSSAAERRGTILIGLIGVAVALAGHAASYLPSIYAQSDYWTSSPTYFFVRLGLLMMTIPIGYFWNAAVPGWSPLQDFGRSSLFVYWVHVELVYGGISRAIHRSLTFEAALLGFALFTVLMFLLTAAKNRMVSRWKGEPPLGAGKLSAAGGSA